MAEKPKPQERPANVTSVRNGQIKDTPQIVKTAILPPPATKPKK